MTSGAAARAAGATTLLFVPGHRGDRFAKAVSAGADLVIFDLQDAVPADLKGQARAAVAAALGEGVAGCVRINPLFTTEGVADVAALAAVAGGDFAVMLPLAEAVADVDVLAEELPGVGVVVLIETARGWAAARDLCSHPAVVRAAFGNLDTAADLGCDPDSPTVALVLQTLVLESRLAGLAGPIAGVTPDFRDPAIAEADAATAKRWGCAGKLCIHPAQLAPVTRGFAPTAAEVSWAQRVLAAVAEAGEGGGAAGGAVAVDGTMVDAPVVARAHRILARTDVAVADAPGATP